MPRPHPLIDDLIDTFDIKVLNVNPHGRPPLPSTKMWSDPTDKNVFANEYLTTIPNPVYTIKIDEQSLYALAQIKKAFSDYNIRSHSNLFSTWMDAQHEEKRLRDTYAAVKEAYEAYSTLLHLCSGNKPLITRKDDV